MRYYYSYNEFITDTKKLVMMIDWEFDTIVAIARGGMTMGHLMGECYNIREVYALNTIGYEGEEKLTQTKIFNIPDLSKSHKVLVVDDIADSGDTLKLVTETLASLYPQCEVRTATLFYKESSIFRPHWYGRVATEWIDFFWSEDLKG